MSADDDRAAELARLLPLLKAQPSSLSLSEVRRNMDEAGRRSKLPRGIIAEPGRVADVPGLWLRPPAEDGSGAILYLHGGGYVCGSSLSHAALAGWLCAAARTAVFVADYRLAPEAPFPAGLDDALAGYRELRKAGPVALAGDSAGGGLALAVALSLRDGGEAAPVGVFVASPWADLTFGSSTYDSRASTDPTLSREDLEAYAAAYLGGVPADHPLASPGRADLQGLSPLLIQVGSEELLLGDALLVARRAAEAGVGVRLAVWPGMFHVFQAYGGALTDARDALAEAGDWLNRRLRARGSSA